jgi:hypothetical protein
MTLSASTSDQCGSVSCPGYSHYAFAKMACQGGNLQVVIFKK